MTTQQKDNAYIMPTYGRFPLTITNGQGSLLYGEDGKEYIDLGSGIAVNTFGTADPIWCGAVSEQLARLAHTSNLYYTSPCADLAETLCVRTGMKKVFFSNSGAEANECAIKSARRYALGKHGKGHEDIITLEHSFHGRTVTTLSATGQEHFHQDFFPFTEGFRYAKPNDIACLHAMLEEKPACAVMLEIVQGEGGVLTLDGDYLQAVEKLCREKDMLFILDEVQTGNGRTGKLFAYMHEGLSPDILTTAKGLGGGLPIGATLFSEKAKDALAPGTHGSTFGGNPAVCAGALSILSRLDDAFLDEVTEKSAYIRERLSEIKGVLSVSGLGLMLGIETARPASTIVKEAREAGVLVLTAKNKVRLLPPLNIPQKTLMKAIDILTAILERNA